MQSQNQKKGMGLGTLALVGFVLFLIGSFVSLPSSIIGAAISLNSFFQFIGIILVGQLIVGLFGRRKR